tara:strand:+ start:1195 stop:1470 length:276 start_codon:yes stop_codon:yes gene_type:complete
MSNTHIFADRVVAILIDHPEGLSSYQIYNRLADDRRNSRWLPSRNSIGTKLLAIRGLEKAGKATGYSAMTSRSVVVWVLDIERFKEWRGIE